MSEPDKQYFLGIVLKETFNKGKKVSFSYGLEKEKKHCKTTGRHVLYLLVLDNLLLTNFTVKMLYSQNVFYLHVGGALLLSVNMSYALC